MYKAQLCFEQSAKMSKDITGCSQRVCPLSWTSRYCNTTWTNSRPYSSKTGELVTLVHAHDYITK